MNKRRSQVKHAKKRFIERHDIFLSDKELEAIGKLIRNGKSVFVRRDSLRVTVHQVVVEGKSVIVVYDKVRRTIITALPSPS